MTRSKQIENIKILNSLFEIDSDIGLENEEIEYLNALNEEIVSYIGQYGETGRSDIRELVTDTLIRDEMKNIIDFLGLGFDKTITSTLDSKLNDENFLKIEDSEKEGDIFVKLLQDDTINDLIMSLRGYERKAEGSKEIFLKKRKALIPTRNIDSMERMLIGKFNKTEFVSKKDDLEQAKIIKLIFSLVFEELLEIPYNVCDTVRTMQVLNMFVVKLTNAIGLSEGFRDSLLETMRESYKSQREQKERQQVQEVEI